MPALCVTVPVVNPTHGSHYPQQTVDNTLKLELELDEKRKYFYIDHPYNNQGRQT
jgi:hypothetical protein